ncbi:MAG TPA: hypothetical protein VM711_04500 [Sphingomicrobium sp.]|nr:hypothetical protein [Sphingomicrobium sp.]
MMARRALIIAGILLVAGCGREAQLEPAQGHKMPVKPAMARAAPTVDQLLTPPTHMRPDRIDELVKKSQPRPEDPFDLPPPTGGAAPSLPAGSDPGAVTNNSSAATPGG